MAVVDVTPEHAAQSPIAGIVRTIARWITAARLRRKKKATLHSLLFAPEHRLRDLGISREELLQAMKRHDGCGSKH